MQKKRGGFFFVSFPDDGETENNEVSNSKPSALSGNLQRIIFLHEFATTHGTPCAQVVELERLRPAYGNIPAQFEKRTFPVPPKLERDMLLTQDSLPKVAKLAELFALNL